MRPLIDPTKANRITWNIMKLYNRKRIDFLVRDPMPFCTKYISMGKYTMMGQKVRAPATPMIWLKYGNSMENPVVNPT